MAEFALGLTKTAVAGTVSMVKSAIEEEAELRVRVQDDLVFITGEFEMMQSFLSASTAGERASKNLVVRTWVRQIRDLAFDVEDCVEFIVHLDKASPWDWVRRFASSVSVMVCMAKPPLPLDLAVGEIKRLKARMEDVSQRNTRYNLLIAHNDTPADPHHLLLRRAGRTSSPAAAAAAATFHALRDVWESSGKLYRTIDLKRLIHCQVTMLQVISLWGSPKDDDDVVIGDLGWATTVKKAYYDPEICREFPHRAWVKSLTHPFNPVEFLNNLLTQFRSHRHDFDGHGGHANLGLSELVKQLSEQRYLIIIEQELTTIADWDAIRMYLPDGKNGSRIVVSTKHLGIALTCTGNPYQVCELKRFSQDQGLYAFFPKGCEHRIGIGELFWQSRHSGVTSVLAESYHDKSELEEGLDKDDVKTAIDKLKFKGCLWPHITRNWHGKLDLVDTARNFIFGFYPENEAESVDEELAGMSDEDIIERCRTLLTEHSYLIFIQIRSEHHWDLMKQHLLPEQPTRSRIVVIADRVDVAKHCVDQDEDRVLNARDLLKGSKEHAIQKEDMVKCELFGRKNCLHALMFKGGGRGWTMSVWGIAGVGKTAVVREMYNTSRNSYEMQGWVDTPNPFNLTELCQRLLLDFYSHDANAKETAAIAMMEGQDPIQWCCKILRESNCLLVIDGLQSTHDWDMVKATLLSQPIEKNSSTIVITREEGIASHCTEGREHTVCNLRGLEDNAALDLFTKIALAGKQLSELDPETQKISKLLVSKCGGFPGAIVAIAERARACSLHIGELNEISFHFMEILAELSSLKVLFCWMESYFDACSDELKPCIFYLSVFPPDRMVRWRRLLRRWVAEGYSRNMSIGGTSVEKGEKFLGKLTRDGILYQDQASTTTRSSKLNGFFHEYISSRPMEDNHVFALEGRSSPHSRLTGQHLTIRESWERDKYAFSVMDLSRLRSLTVFGVWKSFLISDKMKVLRVLDLEGTSTSPGTSVTDNDLEEIVKLFSRLKFLSLRGCIHITRLPDSLGDMRQLQTLDVRFTSIVELPSAITKLHKLQYIRAGTTTDTSPLPLMVQVQAKPSTPPPTPQEDQHVDTSPFLRGVAAATMESTRIAEVWKRKAQYLVKSSWKNLRSRQRVAPNGGGVLVFGAAAEGIGSLIHLHTLGVVSLSGSKRDIFLKELKKLTQLRKLGLSGINRENWHSLCDAISGNLHHLESLSLQLMLLEKDGGSYEFACFDDISELPRSIKRLKVLYTTEGQVASIGPTLIHKLPNLERFNHDLTVSTQEETELIPPAGRWRLRIKPTVEHLSFEDNVRLQLKSLRIECSGSGTNSSHPKVTFGSEFSAIVESLGIHCCGSSSAGTSTAGSSSCGLQIAGLRQISLLKRVTVTGPCGIDLERDLRDQLKEHDDVPHLELAETCVNTPFVRHGVSQEVMAPGETSSENTSSEDEDVE